MPVDFSEVHMMRQHLKLQQGRVQLGYTENTSYSETGKELLELVA